MPQPIDKSIIERMVLAKRLFQQGFASCANQIDRFEFSTGILSLQDSVELVLGAIAGVIGAKLKDQMRFAEYFVAINERLDKDKKLPYERELSLLNKARVSVKHYGILQNPSDPAQAVGAVKPFLEYASLEFLKRDFDKLSLADMIPSEEIRNLVKDAERELEIGTKGSYRECVQFLAAAKYLLFDYEFDQSLSFPSVNYSEALNQTIVSGIIYPSPHSQEIKMLQWGLNVHEFRKLDMVLPIVRSNRNNNEVSFEWGDSKIEGYCHEGNWTPEFLRWAIEFVTDMAIKIEMPPRGSSLIPASEYFEYHITAKENEAVFFAQPNGSFVTTETGKAPSGNGNYQIVFRLVKGKTLTASIEKSINGAWLEVFCPEIQEGKKPGYVLFTDVLLERYPKTSALAKANE